MDLARLVDSEPITVGRSGEYEEIYEASPFITHVPTASAPMYMKKRVSVFNEQTGEGAVICVDSNWSFDDLLKTAVQRIGNNLPTSHYVIALARNKAKIFSLTELRDEDDILLLPKFPTLSIVPKIEQILTADRANAKSKTADNIKSVKMEQKSEMDEHGEEKTPEVVEDPELSAEVMEGSLLDSRELGLPSLEVQQKAEVSTPEYVVTGNEEIPSEDDVSNEIDLNDDVTNATQIAQNSNSKKRSNDSLADSGPKENKTKSLVDAVADPLNAKTLPEEYAPIYEHFFSKRKASHGKLAALIALATRKSAQFPEDIRDIAVEEGIIDSTFKTWNVTSAIRSDISKFKSKSYFTLSTNRVALSAMGTNTLAKISDLDAFTTWILAAMKAHTNHSKHTTLNSGSSKGQPRTRSVHRKRKNGAITENGHGPAKKPRLSKSKPKSSSQADSNADTEKTKVEAEIPNAQETKSETAAQVKEEKIVPRKSYSSSLKSLKEKSVVGWELDNTVWLEGVPRTWPDDSARKRLLDGLKHTFSVTIISLTKDFSTDLWVVSLSTKQEARKVVGKTFAVASGKRYSKTYPIKIVGLES